MHRLSVVLGFLGLAVSASTALGGCAVYSAPPRYEVVAVGSPGPGWVWEPGHWVHYRRHPDGLGPRRSDVFVPGHWRRY